MRFGLRSRLCSSFRATPGATKTDHFAAEILDLLRERIGCGSPRIAIDQLPYHCYKALEAGGVVIEHGQELMELARVIKSDDEVRAMRCAIHACESAMGEMADALRPGMTERELWSYLQAGNIKRAGEWVETQLLASGPRTVPWMQEASSRVIEDGDIVAFDTDLVGPYGMMCEALADLDRGLETPYDCATADLRSRARTDAAQRGAVASGVSLRADLPPGVDPSRRRLLPLLVVVSRSRTMRRISRYSLPPRLVLHWSVRRAGGGDVPDRGGLCR